MRGQLCLWSQTVIWTTRHHGKECTMTMVVAAYSFETYLSEGCAVSQAVPDPAKYHDVMQAASKQPASSSASQSSPRKPVGVGRVQRFDTACCADRWF